MFFVSLLATTTILYLYGISLLEVNLNKIPSDFTGRLIVFMFMVL